MKSVLALSLAALTLATPAFAAPGDSICKALLFDRTATLWLQKDKPVRYQWHNQKALPASISGSVITIAASPKATLSNVVIGKTAKGQKIIRGNWKFKTHTQSDVQFTCTPQ